MPLIFCRALIRPHLRTVRGASIISLRTYASKNKSNPKHPQIDEPVTTKGSHANPTSNLIPSSQRILMDGTAQAEYDKASAKMIAAVDWLRKEIAGLEARGIGRVTPAVLDSVRVVLPDSPKAARLEEVATVGVREGTNLIITLYEDEVRKLCLHTTVASYIYTIPFKNAKYVEKAIYAAKLPNIVPQKVDVRTLRIVIPRSAFPPFRQWSAVYVHVPYRPTMEARATLLNTASKTTEDTRVQIRKVRDTSVRKHKWKQRSDEVEQVSRRPCFRPCVLILLRSAQFQKLCDLRIKEVDQILAKVKKELGT